MTTPARSDIPQRNALRRAAQAAFEHDFALVADLADLHAPSRCVEFINNAFRQIDQSHLWPVAGRFNATERAIRKARRFRRDTGDCNGGLPYVLLLDSLLSDIVNNC